MSKTRGNGVAEPLGNHRNRAWSEECGRQLTLLIGLRGLSIGEFAARLCVSEKGAYKWRVAESEPAHLNKPKIVEVLGGIDDPIWDDDRFRELAICLGARRQRAVLDGVGNGVREGVGAGLGPGPPPEPRAVPEAASATPVPLHRQLTKRLQRLALVGSIWIVAIVLAVFLFRNQEPGAKPPGRIPAGDLPVSIVTNEGLPWHAVFASGARVPLDVSPPRNGSFSFAFRRDIVHSTVTDRRGGRPAILVVSIDTSRPKSSTGHVRADCFALDGSHSWTHFVDDAPAFADTTYAANCWSLEDVQVLDWNADGRDEILLLCTHTQYPSALVVLDAEGRRLTEYWNAGHLRHMVALPADVYRNLASASAIPFAAPRPSGQGPALALSVEFQDAPRGAGMVILAPGFAAGAYPAATAGYRCANLPPERDAVFVRFLPSLVAQKHPAGHNWPENIDYDPASQTIRVTTIEEPEGDGVLRFLDLGLRQVAVMPTDRFKHKFADMQRAVGLPDMTSDAMAASLETIAYRTSNEWESVRFNGVWKP